jgi:hypothetical protein
MLRQDWEEMLAKSGSLNIVHQCPEHFDHSYATTEGSARHWVAVCRNEVGRVVGLTPLLMHTSRLNFDICGHVFGGIPLTQLTLLGSEPILPPSPALHDSLFASLHNIFSDCTCIVLSCVFTSSFLWTYLLQSDILRRNYLPYFIHGVQDIHTIPLPASFDQYLARFGRKKRYNLRRQLRILEAQCQSKLQLQRIDCREGIPSLLKACNQLVRQRWCITGFSNGLCADAEGYRGLADLADRGLLRSYVLKYEDQYLACVLGSQYHGVYFESDTHYRKDLAKFSPGTSLMYLAVEDLINHRPATMINMGFGGPAYTSSATVIQKAASVILFRKNLVNRIYRASHANWRSAISFLKRLRKLV